MTPRAATTAICWRLFFFWTILLADNNMTGFGSSSRTVVAAFAAKKKPSKKIKSAAVSTSFSSNNNKGFGAKPAQVFADIVSTFRTRRPDNALDMPCPCCRQHTTTYLYRDCCAPYHNGDRFPETPTKLLQSRYSAFCYRLIPYVIETTHPSCRDWRENRITWAKELNRVGMFDSYELIGLEKVTKEDPPLVATGDVDGRREVFVEFKVRLREMDSARNEDAVVMPGRETVVSEKSRFLRDESGKWLYASGDVTSEVEGLRDVVLNQ